MPQPEFSKMKLSFTKRRREIICHISLLMVKFGIQTDIEKSHDYLIHC